MAKQDVLADMQALTVAQAESLSLTEITGSDNRLAVVKSSDGPGYSGSLEDIITDFYALSEEDQDWVYGQFCSTSQVMGNRPQDCT